MAKGIMEIPLSYEEVLEGLRNIYIEKYGKKFPEQMVESIHRMKSAAERSPQGAKKLEAFSKEMEQKKLVQMHNYDVPDGILPPGYSAVLHDIKVNCRGRPDDQVYSTNPHIRKMVARGTTTMQLTGPESWYDVIVYANKKFTGGVGDEDLSQPNNDEIWREYCLEPPENAKEIICMEKLNGDAVHFSGRYIGGKFCLFAGSKTTHMLIQNKEHIDLYTGDRYQVAKRFGRTACDTLYSLSNSVQHLLFSFLHHTKCTAICEVLQPEFQHIVDLSHLEENQLNLIAFTPTANEEEETSLTAFPPHYSLLLGKALGLSCAPYTIITPDAMMEQREKIRSERYKEGEVLYYLNHKGETFGIAKAKSVWYIYLRALREKVVHTFITAKKQASWNLEDRIRSMYRRFNEIQSWLHISEASAEAWKKLGESFIRWMNEELRVNRIDTRDLRPKYPQIWKRFLEMTGETDIIPL